MNSNSEFSIIHQITALVVSLIVFIVAWFLSGFFLALLDEFRGLGDSWIQSVFRDVFAPWVGGYLGISAGLSWLSRSTPKFLFFGFTVTILLLIGAYLGLVGISLHHTDVSVGSFLWGAASLAASIFGAFVAAKGEGFNL